MPKVDLSEVKEVTETNSKQTVNDLLKQGWILIDTASGVDESNYPTVRYSLARV